MRLCGLRLLVALLTFGAGVAFSSLWNYLRAPLSCPKYTSESSFVRPNAESALPSYGAPPFMLSEPLTPLERCELGLPVPPDVSAFGSAPETSDRPYSDGVLQGMALSKPVPRYPDAARAARIEGTVRVRIVVGEDGSVLTAKAVSGRELLRNAAVDAACRSSYAPTLLSGTPVKVVGVISYNFVLQ